MRAPALCLLIAVGASGISAVEDAVNSKEVPAQVSYSEVSPRQTSKHPLRAPAALLSPRSPCCVLTRHSTTVTHPAPFSLPWALQDEFKALLDGRSLAEHASRRRLKQGFGYCSGGCLPLNLGCCSDIGMDEDACRAGQFFQFCQWNDMTVPAIIVVCCIVTCIVICCVCCCRRRERRNREMSIPLNVTLMQPGMMQPVMMQPGMVQPGMVQVPYQQMSGKA